MALYRRVDEVLYYIWDPIGISDSAYARSEYQGYLPSLFALVFEGKPKEEIAEKLHAIATGHMGLDDTGEMKKHCLRVAEILLAHKGWYDKKISI